MLISFIILQFLFFPSISSTCKVLLNELNIDTPEVPEKNEFIELIAHGCNANEKPTISYYLLVIVREYEESSRRPIIVFSANLQNAIFATNSQFYVIGAPNDFVNPDLSLSDESVLYRNKFGTSLQIGLNIDVNIQQFHDILENGNKYPMAVILLKRHDAHDTELKQLILSSSRSTNKHRPIINAIPVTLDIENIIKTHFADMYIYSRRAYINKCTLFKRLSNFKNTDLQYKIGSEYDVTDHPDLSINRCATSSDEDSMFLMYTTFKVGKRTPHAENDCSGFHFILLESIERIVDRTACCLPDDSISNIIPESCSATTSGSKINEISSQVIAKYRDCEMKKVSKKHDSNMQCPCPTLEVNKNLHNQAIMLESRLRLNCKRSITQRNPVCQKVRRIDEQPSMPLIRPWEDTSLFRAEWLTQIQKYQARYVATTLFTNENKVWLEYLFAPLNPDISKFRCRICYGYTKDNKLTKNIPLLATVDGYFEKNYKMVWKKISSHTKSFVHEQAIKSLKENYIISLKTGLNDLQATRTSDLTATSIPTVKMIRTVYAEIKLAISMNSHPDIVELQKLNGVDLGTHHFDRTSATKIMESISELMHSTLIKSLKENNHPLSIILDTSTDAANNNFLLIYIRSIENNYPMTYFYRCLHITSETSESLFNVIKDAFKQDKLLEYFKEKAYGFVSDGAPVMLGVRGGLSRLINGMTVNNLYNVHCMAHRLQLVTGHAFDEVNGFKQNFESVVNGLYSFYYDKSFKRKHSLIQTAEELGFKFNELHYIYSIRWVSSEFTALESIYKLYPSIVENMLMISTSNDFTQEISLKAKNYHSTLLDAKFFTTFLLSMDILKILKSVSLDLEKSSASIIGKEDMRLKLFEKLALLKFEQGPFLKTLLDKGSCLKTLRWEPCTLADLDSCDLKLELHKQKLTFHSKNARNVNNNRWIKLSELRSKLINALILKLNQYFPEGSLEIFEVLNPIKLPTELKDVPNYVKKIALLASRFDLQIHVGLIEQQFSNILLAMINDHKEKYCSLKLEGDSVQFWVFFSDIGLMNGQEHFRKLLHISLSLPVGSADVERGFSVMNYFRNKRRSKLTTKHVEDIARIRINGPSIAEFDATLYTLHWLKSNHLPSDATRAIRKSLEKPYQRQSTLF